MNFKSHSNLNNKDIYYMYGYHTVLAAIENPNRHILKIYCTTEHFKKHKDVIESFPFEIIKLNKFETFIGFDKTHQGLVAYVKSKFINSLDKLDFDTINRIVILDQISDAQNIGAIIRSAAAFGIKAIIMPANNSPSENSTIAKVASGCLEKVEILQVVNLKSTIDKLKSLGFWILGLSSNAKEFINEKIISGKMVFVLGSEDKGMRHLTEESCDYIMKFPIFTESLNVASTAAIAFYLSSKNAI